MISVIIPCYNAERYLSDIINDVLAQTYTDWELIVVSNGMHQERQLKVVEAYAFNDPRIKLIHTDVGGYQTLVI